MMDVKVVRAVCRASYASTLVKLELQGLDGDSMAALDLKLFPLLRWLMLGRVIPDEDEGRDALRIMTAPPLVRDRPHLLLGVLPAAVPRITTTSTASIPAA